MDTIVAIIVAILGGLVVYFKKRSDSANQEALLAKTKGQDIEIEQQQKQNQKEIEISDKEISDLRKSQNQDQNSNLTDQQRAERWNK